MSKLFDSKFAQARLCRCRTLRRRLGSRAGAAPDQGARGVGGEGGKRDESVYWRHTLRSEGSRWVPCLLRNRRPCPGPLPKLHAHPRGIISYEALTSRWLSWLSRELPSLFDLLPPDSEGARDDIERVHKVCNETIFS
jgi:hypothetical protein